jgi:hypothetical protein
MDYLLLFLSGLFLANSIPHFVNGISGKDFHTPFLYRYFKNIPSPIFNVIWGILNLVIFILLFPKSISFKPGINYEFLSFGLGFCFASIGLSRLFHNRSMKNKGV